MKKRAEKIEQLGPGKCYLWKGLLAKLVLEGIWELDFEEGSS